MDRIFDMSNPIWKFMGKLVDMLVLTVLWVVCSLPIVTIGASTTALYYVALKLASDQDGYTVSSFFSTFRKNLKQSTIVWLIMLLLGIFLAGDLWWYYQIEGSIGTMMFFMFAILTLIYLMVAVYVFPLLARCETGIRNLFMMAFVMSFKNLGWTLLIITIMACIMALGIFVMAPILIVGMGFIAYLQSIILNFIFKIYHFDIA